MEFTLTIDFGFGEKVEFSTFELWKAVALAGFVESLEEFDAGDEVEDEQLNTLAEQTANEHLSRRFKRFGYFHSNAGEIDFFSANKWCLEVKWAPYAKNLSKAFLQCVIPQKILWTYENFFVDWPH